MPKTPITITAVWLRKIEGQVQVLCEMGGVWRLAIEEHEEGPFSHIAEGNGAYKWPVDTL